LPPQAQIKKSRLVGVGLVFLVGVVFVLRLFSALRAGVLSSCFAKKKVAKEEGDPQVGAGYAGPLRYSAGRAAG
jgi:hypothetical protein